MQSAYIANLTENAYTIEIIKPLADRTRALYDKLIEKGYTEYKHIKSKAADGYYGWEEAAPFDKIIVTCGIDHVPPPLLQQLKAGGLMVIPVGPPGAQRVLKVAKTQGADGSITTSREDIYGGKIVPFVPFTKLEGDKIVGTQWSVAGEPAAYKVSPYNTTDLTVTWEATKILRVTGGVYNLFNSTKITALASQGATPAYLLFWFLSRQYFLPCQLFPLQLPARNA